MNRRRFLGLTAGMVGATATELVAAESSSAKQPMEAFDREVSSFMSKNKVPGGALAVVKDRSLIYARGYGWADRDKMIPVEATSLFRIASISKPFTAVAVMRLIEDGKLKLSDKAFEIAQFPAVVPKGKVADARLHSITIDQLLHHTGGWDRDQSFDPMFMSPEICHAVGAKAPADQTAIIRFMLGQPLDFNPGARYAYSNFGYCVLGRVIEKVTGRPYEQFVRETVLTPIGIKTMRIGASLDGLQAPGEVRYYTPENELDVNLFPGGPRKVQEPYGAFNLEAMDSHGAWIASAVDLARFASALHDPVQCPLLKAETIQKMYAPPVPPVARNSSGALRETYYGCGWDIVSRRQTTKATYWHGGSLPGTSTWFVRRWDGVTWAMLFNLRWGNKKDGAIDARLHRAADSIKEWPTEDLFAKFG